jgi:pyridoxal phosphate enzyme (YggS family)
MSIAANAARIQEQIAAACRHSGRSDSEIALMAVSKMHPAESITEAWSAGLRLFGENRVQEWQQKQPLVPQLLAGPDSLRMHLIGPLQSNKTSRAAELFDAVDTVDSLRIAMRLNQAAIESRKKLPILIEVKLSPEETKHGIAPIELPSLLDEFSPLGGLIPSGLMTVPPWSEEPESARPYFRELRRLRDASLARCSTLTQLSMGMSNDFSVAIEEGSTCVRIGTAIFGKRQYPAKADA